MNLAGKRVLCVLALAIVSLMASPLAYGQDASGDRSGQNPALAEETFKNIQVLRGISVKEFMETMGFFASSLGLNCSDCHGEAAMADWTDYARETPLKQTARRMVIMVGELNKADFGGIRSVTCYTCHRGSTEPQVIPSLAAQYAEPPALDPDLVETVPGVQKVNPEQILDRYIQALGGAAALAKLTSYTGKGTYSGFDSDFASVPLDFYAQSPGKRATVAHMKAGESTTACDGTNAWSAGPPTLSPLPIIPFYGDSLLGARVDALLTFPLQIKQAFTGWHAGFPELTIDGKAVDVIEGSVPGSDVRVRLYFDKQTGLLVRQARLTGTEVGVISTHWTYSDYRTIPGVGVKVPFQWQITWVDGQSNIKLTSVQPNVAIDAAKFGRPAPPK